MDVEVNEENIELFALVQMTGNTREEMLSRAAEAAESGYVLSVTIPDDQLHQNVFDNYLSQTLTDPANVRCRYELQGNIFGEAWVCVIHHAPANQDVNTESTVHCSFFDPSTKD